MDVKQDPSAIGTLAIVTYRDFFDVPRYVLAQDAHGHLWVLDCPFDETTDDYAQHYSLYDAGTHLDSARSVFEAMEAAALTLIDTTPVDDVRFDESRRSTLVMSGFAGSAQPKFDQGEA